MTTAGAPAGVLADAPADMPAGAPAVPRYANIDGLRALAAFCVMVEHAAGDILREAPDGGGALRGGLEAATGTLSLGRFGVALFFLISGFVVPFSLRGPRPLAHFAVSRVFRLYPAMWLALASIVALSALAGRPPPPATVAADMTMMPTFLGREWLSGSYWTLTIEMIFYAAIMALFALRWVRRPRIAAALAIALVAATLLPVALRGHARLPVQYVGFHLSFLFLGLLLRLAMVDRLPRAGTAALALVAAQGVTLWAVADFSLARGDRFVLVGLGPVIGAYALAILVFCAAIRFDRPRSALAARLGVISYSLYLFHGIVADAIRRVAPPTGAPRDLAVAALGFAATVAVSALTYALVEQPMIALGRRLVRRLRLAGA